MSPRPDAYSELLTLEEFQAALAAGDRIVITDVNKESPTVHAPSCYSVTEEHFVMKVITNGRASGQYFRARNTRIAKERGAVPCGHCYQ